jgi:predicted DNA-binding transcriptional regulator YafY
MEAERIEKQYLRCLMTAEARRGELIVFDKLSRPLVGHILLPVPTGTTKGVLVAPTVFGNVMVGPTAEDVERKDDTSSTAVGLEHLRREAVRIVPELAGQEVTAVYVGLRAATGIAGVAETSARALAKLDQVLPDHLRRKLAAVVDAMEAGPVNTDSNVPDPDVDAGTLQALATAIRDCQGVRADYRDEPIEVEPYRLVAWQRRWYLVARDPRADAWLPLRVDWLRLKVPGGRPFHPADPPPFDGQSDLTEFVVREVARTGWTVHARLVIAASAEEVISRINPAVGTVEPIADDRSVLVTGGDSLEVVAVWIGMLGLDFTVESPPELRDHLEILAKRYTAAGGDGGD